MMADGYPQHDAADRMSSPARRPRRHGLRIGGTRRLDFVPICGELLNLAETTSVAQSCEFFAS
jgi:hypothetical protein